MEMTKKTPILLYLIMCLNSVSGLDVPRPDDLVVNILDGDVIVYWKHPVHAPSNAKYNVQMGKYNGEWTKVETCTEITRNFCNLSSFIPNYNNVYKVRVRLVVGDNVSAWVFQKVRPNESELQPPSFTLLATSRTLSVYVQQKPILKELFPFGLTYTIYLEEKGQDNKVTIAYLKEADQNTFSSLHWGREYCISMMVEGNGALSRSGVSPKKCLKLPEQEWYIIAISSLSVLGVLAIIAISAIVLVCYLKRPEKTPAALKSPENYWRPLTVGDGSIEVVTDKGWLLSSYRTEVKKCVKDQETHLTVIEDSEDEKRRTSMDSGVSMQSSSAIKNEESPLMRQDDSGCGSLGGPETTTSSQTDYPLSNENDTSTVQKREDSGVGLGCQLDSSSTNMDGQDNGLLKESVTGGNYCTQSPSAVQIHVCDDEEAFKQIIPDTVLAEVVTGYRAGPQSCICSGTGKCTWCHNQGQFGSEVVKQYRSMCIENRSLKSKCDFVDSYKAGITFSSYSKKSQMNNVLMDDFKNTFTQLGETFPLLTTLVEGGHDFNMNNVSLCDVQLATD